MTLGMPRFTLITRGTIHVKNVLVILHVIILSTPRMRIFRTILKRLQVVIIILPLSTTVTILTAVDVLTHILATDLHHVMVLLVPHLMYGLLIILATRIIIITITKY